MFSEYTKILYVLLFDEMFCICLLDILIKSILAKLIQAQSFAISFLLDDLWRVYLLTCVLYAYLFQLLHPLIDLFVIPMISLWNVLQRPMCALDLCFKVALSGVDGNLYLWKVVLKTELLKEIELGSNHFLCFSASLYHPSSAHATPCIILPRLLTRAKVHNRLFGLHTSKYVSKINLFSLYSYTTSDVLSYS